MTIINQLFCSSCGHQYSIIGGSWVRRYTADEVCLCGYCWGETRKARKYECCGEEETSNLAYIQQLLQL